MADTIEYRTVFAPLVRLMRTDKDWLGATLDKLIAEAMVRSGAGTGARIEAINKAVDRYNETKDDATITLMYKAKAANEAEKAERAEAKAANEAEKAERAEANAALKLTAVSEQPETSNTDFGNLIEVQGLASHAPQQGQDNDGAEQRSDMSSYESLPSLNSLSTYA